MAAIVEITSTKDFKRVFDELTQTDRFKRKLDEVFEKGYKFEVKTASPFKHFVSKKGCKYGAILSNGKKTFGVKKCGIQNALIRLNEINNKNNYRNLSKEPVGTIKINDVTYKTYTAEKYRVENTNWAEISKIVGKLIKKDIAETVKCSTCNGVGIRPEFMYYADGICFDCMGIGKWFEIKH